MSAGDEGLRADVARVVRDALVMSPMTDRLSPSDGNLLDRSVDEVVTAVLALLAEPDPVADEGQAADSGYCPDECTWPHSHRFERDGIPWPARAARGATRDGGAS